MRTIFISYPWWFILLCILTALVYALGMYYKFKGFGEEYKVWNWVLSGFRAIAIFLICFLLLQPYIKQTNIEEQLPIVILAHDKSQSIQAHFKDSTQVQLYTSAMEQLNQALMGKYEVDQVSFGDKVTVGNSNSFQDVVTDIGALFDYVEQSYAGQSVAAMIIASDGIYNQGINPLYKIEGVSFPVHTIALGDTTIQKDLYIQKVYHNRLGYLGDQLRILIDHGAYNFKGERVKLQIRHKGRVIESHQIDITETTFFNTFELPIELSHSGLQRYDIILSNLDEEKTWENNRTAIFIEVIDTRQQLMILAAAPHPDLGAIRRALETNDNFEIDVTYLSEGIPNMDSVDMMVLHQIPSDQSISSELLRRVRKMRMPHLMIVGPQTDFNSLNSQYEDVEIQTKGNMTNQVEASISEQFTTFKLTDELKSLIKMAPPLNARFADFKIKGSNSVLLYQLIRGIPTDYPLLTFLDKQDKIGFLFGTGIWKWRIVDFVNQQDHRIFDSFINQIIQYISTKEDKKRFRTFLPEASFTENQDITVYAELYNPSYELVNNPDVSIEIKNEAGNTFNYQMNKEDQTYKIELKGLSEGLYSYRSRVEYAGQMFTAKGEFSVERIQVEGLNTTTDLGLLYGLSNQTNGQLVFDDQLDSLRERLLTNSNYQTVLYESQESMPLIYYKVLFAVILLLLILEWFFRRYYGTY